MRLIGSKNGVNPQYEKFSNFLFLDISLDKFWLFIWIQETKLFLVDRSAKQIKLPATDRSKLYKLVLVAVLVMHAAHPQATQAAHKYNHTNKRPELDTIPYTNFGVYEIIDEKKMENNCCFEFARGMKKNILQPLKLKWCARGRTIDPLLSSGNFNICCVLFGDTYKRNKKYLDVLVSNLTNQY